MVEETVRVRAFQFSLGEGMMPSCDSTWQIKNSPHDCRESCVKSSTEKLPKDLSKPQGLWWGDTVVREKHVGRSEED